jgi:hypothetical protein
VFFGSVLKVISAEHSVLQEARNQTLSESGWTDARTI